MFLLQKRWHHGTRNTDKSAIMEYHPEEAECYMYRKVFSISIATSYTQYQQNCTTHMLNGFDIIWIFAINIALCPMSETRLAIFLKSSVARGSG